MSKLPRSFLACMLLSHGLFAQQYLLNPEKSLSELSIAQWTTQQGLASNNITSVSQASDGLLWITSFNGLMVYDGERIEIYDLNNLPILDTDGFYVAEQADDGTIYFGSQGSGLVRYHKGRFERYQPKYGSVPKSIRSLYFSKVENTLYIGSHNSGLFSLHNDTITQVHHPNLNPASVIALLRDGHDNLWAGTDGDGLFRVYPNGVDQFTRADGLVSNNILCLAIHPDNTLIIGTNKGLMRKESDRFSSFEALKGSDVNALYVDNWNSIWVGTQDGIARIDSKQRVEWLRSKSNIDFVRVTSIIQDSEQNIWLTSNRSGLIRLKETNITNLTQPALPSNRVYSVHQTPDGRLCIGTDANALTICKETQCKTIPLKTHLGGNGIRDIYFENDNSIWLATYSGIIHLKDGREIIYSSATGMPADDFRTVMKDTHGNFWFGSRSGGLIRFRDGKIMDIYNIKTGLKSNYVLSVIESANNVYVGTHSGGMSVLSADGSIQTYHAKADDAGFLIFNIRPDTKGRVWLITNLGPHFFDGDSIRAVSLSPDRRSKTYFDWVDDETGNIWMSTSIGVMKLSREELTQFAEQKRTYVNFQLYDEEDGMSNKECTGATRSILGSDNKVYLPTLGGICIIDPSDTGEGSSPPGMLVRSFVTDYIAHNPYDNQIKVKPGSLRYSFRFSALSLRSPERNQYRYMLVGLDKDWSEAVNEGEVEYTNLSPGTYTFRVIGCNDRQQWNNKGASVKFTVLPYFYQTFWFYLLLICLLAMLLYVIHRWRLTFIERQNEALRKVNSELDRFVYSASHDLRSPLSSVLGLINIAKNDPHPDKSEYLKMIEKSVLKLDSFIRDIIDFSRNARLELTNEPIVLSTMIHDIFEDLRFLENFPLLEKEFIDRTQGKFYSDPKRVRIILSNLIANAIKHHHPRLIEHAKLTIEAADKGGGVQVDVSDNGPGIEQAYLKDIFKMFFRATSRTPGSGLGLYIVKETVDRLNGKISVESTLNEGAKFTVWLPNKSPQGAHSQPRNS